jgi:pimeloyl-ACP methyl ester carboxylesterase
MSDFTERFVNVADGLTIYARDYQAARDDRLPIVCIPGFTRNSAEFHDVALRLAAYGRRVIAIDNRGRGRSSADPRPERYVYDTYAADAIAVLDSLGIAKAIFLGQSMGGRVSLFAYRLAPERFGAIIFNDSGPTPPAEGLARAGDYLKYTRSRFASWEALGEMLAIVNASVYPDADQAFYVKFAHQVGRKFPEGIGLDIDPAIGENFNRLVRPGGAPARFTDMIRDLRPIPILLIHGMLSDLVTDACVAEMRQLDLDLSVVDVPNVGHCPTLEEPEAWAGLTAFLDGVP